MFLGWKVRTKKPSFCWLHFLFRDCHLLMRSRAVSCWTNISMLHTCCCEAGGNKIARGLRKIDMVVLQWLVCRHVLGQGWGLHTYILVSVVCWLVWTGLFGSQLQKRDVLKELVCAYELVFWICMFNLLSLLLLVIIRLGSYIHEHKIKMHLFCSQTIEIFKSYSFSFRDYQ